MHRFTSNLRNYLYHGIGGEEQLDFPGMAILFGNSKQANQQAYGRALRKLRVADSHVKRELEEYFLDEVA